MTFNEIRRRIENVTSRRRGSRPCLSRESLTHEFKCAVCSFNVRIDQHTICQEAAHVKWHQAASPDEVSNGLALCTMHHKMLDFCAFQLSDCRRVVVSERVNGTYGVNEWLLAYHGRAIRRPQRLEYALKDDYIQWHVREVLRGFTRELRAE